VEPSTGEPLLGLSDGQPTGLLGAYLSYIVENSSNIQKFEEGNVETISATRGTNLKKADDHVKPLILGTFTRPSNHCPWASTWFQELDKLSNSLYFDAGSASPGTGLSKIIDKVGGTAPAFDSSIGELPSRPAHDLLKRVNEEHIGDAAQDYVVEASTRALRYNNRFSDALDEGFTATSTTMPRQAGKKNLSVQTKMGNYENDYYHTSIKKLSNVAATLMLRSTGYSLANTPGDDSDAAANVSAIIESIEAGDFTTRVQGGPNPSILKTNIKSLQARHAHGAPSIGGFAAKDGGRSIPVVTGSLNAESFGTTYNPYLTFTGRGHKAHKIKAALSILALYDFITSVFTSISFELQQDDLDVYNALMGDVVAFSNKGSVGTLEKGKSRRMTNLVANSWFKLQVLTPLEVDYSQALLQGLVVLFGSEIPGPLSQDVLNESVNAAGIGHKHRYSDSPGYWSAVCDSVIRETNSFLKKLALLDETDYDSTYETIVEIVRVFNADNRLMKFMNVVAMIGEKSILDSNNLYPAGVNLERNSKPRGPDALNALPANRVGKSRIGNNRSGDEKTGSGFKSGVLGEASIAWSSTSTPSMYLLPVNIIRAANRLNNSFSGENPAAGMLGSQMVRNTYTGLDVDGTSNRIPERVVKIVEDRLDSEYVPFYFHDLRTNEIISFHAFLSSLEDDITPNYNKVSGYGRMDPVLQYENTTRSLSVSFTVYATKKEDFDEMWFKINKLVTMLYPQWSQGTLLHSGDAGDIELWSGGPVIGREGADFYQPFSQVIGASPIIRLRIGDVIKSNYSRFNLSRLFGIGDPEVKARPTGDGVSNVIHAIKPLQDIMNATRDILTMVLVAVYGSYHGLVELAARFIPGISYPSAQIALNGLADISSESLASIMVNGFTTTKANAQILNLLQDPESFPGAEGPPGSHREFNVFHLAPNMVDGYFCEDTGQTIYTTRRMWVKPRVSGDEIVSDLSRGGETMYRVKVEDPAAGEFDGLVLLAKHRDIQSRPDRLFNATQFGQLMMAAGLDQIAGLETMLSADIYEGSAHPGGNSVANALHSVIMSFIENPESHFMRPEINPFVKSFHATRGRGLAGVMTGINFKWLDKDIPWETDYNARAPIGCEISFGFDVVHDIPPGLDHSGYNRAPLYNVGSIMRSISGDVYSEINSTSELLFRRGGGLGASGLEDFIRSTGTPRGKGKV